MDGKQLRQARIERGWTQAELAVRVGRSQATISAIENEKVEPTAVLRHRLDAALATPDPGQALEVREPSPPFRLPDLVSPSRALGLPVAVARWQRPEASGDFVLLVPLPGDSLLLAAVDVTGHGSGVVPASLYVQGWLRGWLGSQRSAPRLRSLVLELSRELKSVGVDGAGYFALLTSHPGRHAASLEGFCLGFPPPLLLAGPPFRTLDPPDLGPPLPLEDRELPLPQVQILSAPWRLALASDGLLGRLGGGDERQGLRKLREWQTSYGRDLPPGEYLATGEPPADDETFACLQWTGWDLESAFLTRDDGERHRTIEIIRQEATGRLGSEKAGRLEQALIEALDNARRHAYPGGEGVVRVRWRQEHGGVRAEVEDEGRNQVDERKFSARQSGFAVMKAMVDEVDVRVRGGGGTIVTLALSAPAETRDAKEGGGLGV
jgi:transcriptional regulator with XRE-family HTH domain/anti-sigma regulatory factor (Ser/Thr protein kinase)